MALVDLSERPCSQGVLFVVPVGLDTDDFASHRRRLSKHGVVLKPTRGVASRRGAVTRSATVGLYSANKKQRHQLIISRRWRYCQTWQLTHYSITPFREMSCRLVITQLDWAKFWSSGNQTSLFAWFLWTTFLTRREWSGALPLTYKKLFGNLIFTIRITILVGNNWQCEFFSHTKASEEAL